MDNKFLKETDKDKEFPFWSLFLLFSLLFLAVRTIMAIFIVLIKPEVEIAYVISVIVNILFILVICFYFKWKLYFINSFIKKLRFILFIVSVMFFGGFIPSLFSSMGFELFIIFIPTVIFCLMLLIVSLCLKEFYREICQDNGNLDKYSKLQRVIQFFNQLSFNQIIHDNPEVRYFYSSTMLFMFILISNYVFSLMNSNNQVYLLTAFFVIIVVGYVLFNLISHRKKQKTVSLLKIILTYLALEIGILFSPLYCIYDDFMLKYLFKKIFITLGSLIITALVCKCILLIIRKQRKLPV